MASNISKLKRQERWENDVRTAKAQQDIIKKQFHLYELSCCDVIKRYKAWLAENKMESTINLDQYT